MKRRKRRTAQGRGRQHKEEDERNRKIMKKRGKRKWKGERGEKN